MVSRKIFGVSGMILFLAMASSHAVAFDSLYTPLTVGTEWVYIDSIWGQKPRLLQRTVRITELCSGNEVDCRRLKVGIKNLMAPNSDATETFGSDTEFVEEALLSGNGKFDASYWNTDGKFGGTSGLFGLFPWTNPSLKSNSLTGQPSTNTFETIGDSIQIYTFGSYFFGGVTSQGSSYYDFIAVRAMGLIHGTVSHRSIASTLTMDGGRLTRLVSFNGKPVDAQSYFEIATPAIVQQNKVRTIRCTPVATILLNVDVQRTVQSAGDFFTLNGCRLKHAGILPKGVIVERHHVSR